MSYVEFYMELDISDDISGISMSYIHFASSSGDIKSPPGSGGDCWYHGRQAVSGPIYTGLGHSSHCFWVVGMETGDWIVAYVGVQDYLGNNGYYCGAAWCSAYPSDCSSKNCLGILDMSASTVTVALTPAPTLDPTNVPTAAPTAAPIPAPTTAEPSAVPTTSAPTTAAPTAAVPPPSAAPTAAPTSASPTAAVPPPSPAPTETPPASQVSGTITVSGMTLADAQANVAVFQLAVAEAAGVDASAVECTISVSTERRLTDTLEVLYVIATNEVASAAILDDMEALTTSDFDAELQASAAALDESALFASVATDDVSEPEETAASGTASAAARLAPFLLAAAALAAL